MAIYGAEITSSDLVTQLSDEVSKEVAIPNSDLLDASFPVFQEHNDAQYDDVQGMGGYGVIPSGIPSAIDKLWKYNNRVPDIDPPVSPVLKLKNTMNEDYTLQDNYNGACIDLNTIGYMLRVEQGSTLIAL